MFVVVVVVDVVVVVGGGGGVCCCCCCCCCCCFRRRRCSCCCCGCRRAVVGVVVVVVLVVVVVFVVAAVVLVRVVVVLVRVAIVAIIAPPSAPSTPYTWHLRAGSQLALSHADAFAPLCNKNIVLYPRPAMESARCSACGLGPLCADGAELKKCSRCETRMYCSRKCQKKDWRFHKPSCTRPLHQVRVLMSDEEDLLIDGCSREMKVRGLKRKIQTVKGIRYQLQDLLIGLNVLANRDSLQKAGVIDASCVKLVKLERPESADDDMPFLSSTTDTE